MSEVVEKFHLGRACKYNAKSTCDLPLDLMPGDTSWASRRDSEAFAWAIFKIQKEVLNFPDHECDGKLGHQTFMAILQEYDPRDEEYVIKNGKRIHIPKSDDYSLITFDEPGGLDLHRFGNFSRRNIEPFAICMHWGGLNPQHCFNVFASQSRQVSSHFLIGLTDGKPVVYQVLDMQHKAWHGGWVNDESIGIDVCQSPMKHWKEHYESDPAYDIEDLDNPTSRGPKKLISLDPTIAQAVDSFISDLLDALGWDFVAPEDHNVYKDISDFTIFGHHHVNERKYDIAPWWDFIFPADEV